MYACTYAPTYTNTLSQKHTPNDGIRVQQGGGSSPFLPSQETKNNVAMKTQQNTRTLEFSAIFALYKMQQTTPSQELHLPPPTIYMHQ